MHIFRQIWLSSRQMMLLLTTVIPLVVFYKISNKTEREYVETPWIPLNIETTNVLTNHMFGDEAYRDTLLRPTKYLVVPSPDCRNARFLVLVYTITSDFETRDRWRRFYGGRRMRHKFAYCVIFPIGSLRDFNETTRLVEEINLFDDILQGDYLDSYRNLTMKTLSALRFAAVAYPKVDSILKIDDDVAWNVPLVTNYIKSRVLPNSISCYKSPSSSPVRKNRSKWYVTYDEYPGESYPEYCFGVAYVLHRTAVLPMLSVLPQMKYFWIDDVFVTGFMARAATVSLIEINQYTELKPIRRDISQKIFYNDMMFYGTSKENIGRQFINRTEYVLLFN
ncbi:hypothetical protein RB195_017072 [Necator americanus]|uniref:Hexosyltransferase n=1 Tax=Necator americanus TaxID=51031 RepID=A0ABR1C3G3_NECAM